MSQRKEKYIRRALEGADIAETALAESRASAAALHHRMDGVVRDVQQVRDDQARLARSTRRRHRYEDRAAQRATRLALVAMLLAILAMAVTIITARVEAEKRAEALAAVERAGSKAVVIPPANLLTTALAPTLYQGPAEEVKEPAYLSDAIPMSYDLQAALWDACEATGVPYALALGVIEKETQFQNIAGDGGTSLGYMQVKPSCHYDRMERLGVTDLWDPAGNFLVGCDYLAEMMAKTDTTAEALMAYNMGPSGASNLWKEGVRESEYSRKVMAYAETRAETLETLGS